MNLLSKIDFLFNNFCLPKRMYSRKYGYIMVEHNKEILLNYTI